MPLKAHSHHLQRSVNCAVDGCMLQKHRKFHITASTQSTAESADCWCEFERALIVMYFVCRRTASRSVHSIPLQIRTCQPEVRAVEARADVVRCHFRETPPPTEDEIFVVDVVQFLCLDFGLNCKLSFLCTFYRIGPRAKCQNWLNSNSELSLSSIFPPIWFKLYFSNWVWLQDFVNHKCVAPIDI